MASIKQVVFASDFNGSSGTFMLEDLTTGRTLSVIKGCGVIQSRGLSVTTDFVAAAEKDSQLLRFWSHGSGYKKDHKIICPGVITSLTATSCGTIIFVAIGDKIYVWQTSTGQLITILEEAGFQSTSVIKMSPSDHLLATGSHDGVVCFWKVSSLISKHCSLSDKITAFRTFNEAHSSSVSDLSFGLNHFIASVGLDKKCVVYDVDVGCILFQLAFDSTLHSVVIDPGQYLLMTGSASGVIHEVKLYDKTKANTVTTDTSKSALGKDCYTGHSSKVSCLCISIDGQALVSGSHDSSIRIWNTLSKQCMRTVSTKGPVGCLAVFPLSTQVLEDPSMKNSVAPLSLPKTFSRSFQTRSHRLLDVLFRHDRNFVLQKKDQTVGDDSKKTKGQKSDGNVEVSELREINRKLYEFIVSKNLNNAVSSQFKGWKKKRERSPSKAEGERMSD